MSTKEEVLEEKEIKKESKRQNELVLYNDDVNTFDHVVDCLINFCDHTLEQAEQCSILVHYKGKCTVKTGEYSDLKPRCTGLLNEGLSAEII